MIIQLCINMCLSLLDTHTDYYHTVVMTNYSLFTAFSASARYRSQEDCFRGSGSETPGYTQTRRKHQGLSCYDFPL